MSIEQTDKVDVISLNKDSDECVLTISDHLDWTNEMDHYLLLQDKINAYLKFIESGEIFESYPKSRGKKLRIDVVFKYEPPNRKTLDLIKAELNKSGFVFTSRHIPTDT